MLEEILLSLNNRCTVDGVGMSGTYEISSGSITIPELLPGQYFWIDGSVFNDGLHQYPAVDLTDETFTGRISPASIPKGLKALADEIEIWAAENPVSDKSSESFGGYSYSRGSSPNGAPLSWADIFARRLNKWRKV